MNKGQDADEYLMGQVVLGKREYLEPLVRRYASSLLTYLHRMVGDQHRAEELFQEVFLAVWLKRKTFKFPKPFRPWLFAIAANRCRADFRKASLPVNEAEPEHHVDSSGSPLDSVVATETTTLVKRAVANLPTQQRNVVVMRIWNQLSFAEIAEVVGRTEGTVRSNMHHGLAALRKQLEQRL